MHSLGGDTIEHATGERSKYRFSDRISSVTYLSDILWTKEWAYNGNYQNNNDNQNQNQINDYLKNEHSGVHRNHHQLYNHHNNNTSTTITSTVIAADVHVVCVLSLRVCAPNALWLERQVWATSESRWLVTILALLRNKTQTGKGEDNTEKTETKQVRNDQDAGSTHGFVVVSEARETHSNKSESQINQNTVIQQ